MAELRCSNGHVALVDEADLPRLAGMTWHGRRIRRGDVYVYSGRRVDGADVVVPLHRFIMEAADGVLIDHINGDPLDNRRSNLRFATVAQNAWNRRRRIPNKTGYVGVCRYVRKGLVRFEARIMANGQSYYALRETALEAAIARDELALRHHGEFAVLNFPQRTEAA